MAADTVLYWSYFEMTLNNEIHRIIHIRRTPGTGYSQITLGGYMPWNDPQWSASYDPAIATELYIDEEIHPKHLTNFFYGLWKLKNIYNITNLYTDECIDMTRAFCGCWELDDNLDLSHWDTSKTTNMFEMFSGCSQLYSINVSSFDTSHVTDMGSMFYNCDVSSLDVSNWDVSSVTNMESMFMGCTALTTLDVSNWDVSSVTTMQQMFYDCDSLTTLNVSNWITSNVTTMQQMFHGCSSLTTLNVSGWNTANVTNMSELFNDCSSLTSLNVSSWNTAKVTNMGWMFDGCRSLTSLNPSNFNTSRVKSMACMFRNCNSLTILDISNFSFAGLNNSNSLATMFAGSPGINNIYFPLSTTSYSTDSLFTSDSNQHYLLNKNNSASSSIISFWKNVAASYPNVHYEFDDNSLPTVGNLSALRVASNGSRTFSQQGLYAYLSASAIVYSDYLPTGYTNELKLPLNVLVDNISPSTTPTWTLNSSTNMYETWIQLSDTNGHDFKVAASDSIKKNNVQVASRIGSYLSYVLSKVFTLVDYYHESNSSDPNYGKEGIAFGKYATTADMFDCDMPSRFTSSANFTGSVIIERLIGEIKTYAGLTVPIGWLECDGSEVLIEDYPLLAAALGADHPDPNDPDYVKPIWGTPTSYNSFILPDLTGRTPIGASNSTEWVTIIRENPSSTFTLNTPTYCRIGSGTNWSNEALLPSGTYTASYTSLTQYFPTDPASGVAKVIQAKLTVGSSGGESEHILTTSEMPTHTHIQDSHGHSLTNAGYFLYNTSAVDRKTVKSGTGASNMLHSDGATSRPGSAAIANTATNQNTGGSLSHSLMQPFAVVKYIICAA